MPERCRSPLSASRGPRRDHGLTLTNCGRVAAGLGHPDAARAVGLANGQNPIPIIVACHRVIGANGSLTGYGGGLEAKRWLLDHEARHAGLTLV
jgi:methylated-DNA-[protein]-cysteine S-methyltransferase